MSEPQERPPIQPDKVDSSWSWLTHTWLGPVLSLIGLVSSPLVFVESRAFVWTSGIAALATGMWWWTSVLNAWEPPTLFGPKKRRFTKWQIGLRCALPLTLTSISVFLLIADVSRLNIWRRDFPERTLVKDQNGTVNKFFGDTAPRTTAMEREEYERAEWIRWLNAGAAKQSEKADLLFVKSKPFSGRYHTFALDVHDLSKQIRPCSTGVAFLVTDKPRDAWNRRTFRQVPCDLAGDANTRLFRVLIENPEPEEYLWMFLCVTPTNPQADLDALDLQLMVRQ